MLQTKTLPIERARALVLLIPSLMFVGLAFAQPTLCTSNTIGSHNYSDAVWSCVDGSSTPPSGANVTITNATITMDSDVTIGTLTLSNSGYVNLGSATITIEDQLIVNELGGINDDGGTSTVIFTSTVASDGSSSTVGGSNDHTLYNVVVASGSTVAFGAGDGVSPPPGSTTITNELKLDGGAVVTYAPFYGSASTLVYDDTHTSVGPEWTAGASSGKGVPHHVSVGTGSSLDFGSTSSNYTCTGNLTVNGASASIDLADMTGTLTVDGNASFGTTSAVSVALPSAEGASKLAVGGDLTLGANATVTGDEANVEVGGNLANSVTGMAFGLLKMNGSADQDVTGSKITVDSLVVANTQNAVTNDTDVDFQADVDIVPGGVFNPIDGTAKISGTFTMNSDSTGTARIATLADDGSTSDVDGDITFERYVPSTASTTWLIMGNYVTASPALKVQDWMDDFGGSIYVYSHDETVNSSNGGSGSNGWTYMNAASALSTSGEGYFSMVPTSLGTSGHTLSNTGTHGTATVTRFLTHSVGSYSQYHDPAGWNLLCNPYPSPIDGDAFVSNNSGVSEYYIYDNASGNWLSSSQAGALEAPDAIDIGQGFYAYVASGNAGNASFTPDLACYGANTFTRSFDPLVDGMFAVHIQDDESRFGATTIKFHEEGTSGLEAELDAPYKAGANYNPRIFSHLADGSKLAVNSIESIENLPENVSLTIQTGQAGTVTIQLDPATEVPEGLCARLVDSETGTAVALGAESMIVELEPFSTYEERFFVEFLFVPVFEQTTSLCEGGTIHFVGESTEDWLISWANGETEGTGCVSGLDPGTYELDGVNMLNGCAVSNQVEIPEICMGDFNFNGDRDIPDLLMLLVEMQGASNAVETTLQSDCDCDGLITTSDLLMFLPYFGASCE